MLQTTYLNDLHVPPEDDGDSRSHGTAAASKAVGRKYGLAKEVCYSLVSLIIRHKLRPSAAVNTFTAVQLYGNVLTCNLGYTCVC